MIQFEPYRDDHLEPLVLMWRKSFEQGVGIVDPHPVAEQRQYFLDEVVPKYVVRVALSQSQVVGFIASDAESIAQLYVHPEHQGQGIGRQVTHQVFRGTTIEGPVN